ncbi:hypothetical protein [Wenyingzhuangia marina]|uniref:Uncharacterized protein n=1 Tax=Wenyingzhuangia marina TaxID=1195760 RepID=A0A1M5T263_9FLAO|nr:hypothetical protein [Wenyingzhuangia marina]GGF65087.1 hypothetical protein GCM10011397_05100 [Wenyingzhuangia marina]SHH44772.1 hypothetical protein SAMN05444281_0653 [Wenyingzhuangia marina]
MKKLLIKFLLLSIVLLSGYGQLYGYITEVNTPNNFIQAENTSANVYGNHQTYVAKSTLAHFEKFNCEIEITDSEDDEITSLKKNFTASPYFANKNSIPTSDYIIHYIQQASFFKKLSHLISCKRYILLRVIRI